LKAASAASAVELKSEKTPKAKQILLRADTHIRGCHVGRKIEHGGVGAVEKLSELGRVHASVVPPLAVYNCQASPAFCNIFRAGDRSDIPM
jgi:hypothetical protein